MIKNATIIMCISLIKTTEENNYDERWTVRECIVKEFLKEKGKKINNYNNELAIFFPIHNTCIKTIFFPIWIENILNNSSN